MNNIKQKLTILLLAVGLFMFAKPASAQTKIGFINAMDVLSRLPETKAADSVINAFRLQLDQENKALENELETLSIKFNTDSAKMTPVEKETARKNLQPIYLKVVNFSQDAQKRMEAKQRELIAPIQKKTLDVIQQVATENGYTHVFSRESLIIVPPGDDLYPLVKKKLNLP